MSAMFSALSAFRDGVSATEAAAQFGVSATAVAEAAARTDEATALMMSGAEESA